METLSLQLPRATKLTMENLRLLVFGWICAPCVLFAEKYLFHDVEFVINMALLILFDTILGSIIAWRAKPRKFNSRGMLGTPMKVIVYGIALSTIHIITNNVVKPGNDTLSGDAIQYLDSTMYAFLVLREVKSIAENMNALGYNLFPAWLIGRIALILRLPTGAGAGEGTPPEPDPARTPANAQERVSEAPPARTQNWGGNQS